MVFILIFKRFYHCCLCFVYSLLLWIYFLISSYLSERSFSVIFKRPSSYMAIGIETNLELFYFLLYITLFSQQILLIFPPLLSDFQIYIYIFPARIYPLRSTSAQLTKMILKSIKSSFNSHYSIYYVQTTAQLYSSHILAK